MPRPSRCKASSLQVAVKHVEDRLEPFANEQAAKGNVTIANWHHEFDSRYRFAGSCYGVNVAAVTASM
jgi:hypothetical protein